MTAITNVQGKIYKLNSEGEEDIWFGEILYFDRSKDCLIFDRNNANSPCMLRMYEVTQVVAGYDVVYKESQNRLELERQEQQVYDFLKHKLDTGSYEWQVEDGGTSYKIRLAAEKYYDCLTNENLEFRGSLFMALCWFFGKFDVAFNHSFFKS